MPKKLTIPPKKVATSKGRHVVPPSLLNPRRKTVTKRPKVTPAEMLKLEREAMVMDLRKRGYDYHQIAKKVGVGAQRCREIAREVMARMRDDLRESAEEMRHLELERLDIATKVVMDELVPEPYLDGKGNLVQRAPDIEAVPHLIRIQERRTKLVGLDAAQKVQFEDTRREYVGVDVDKV